MITLESQILNQPFFLNNSFSNEIITSQGFSVESLLRGMIGMIILISISYIISNKRRAINWKAVIIGLAIQIILAVSVLKIPFVQSIFESAGKIFVKILDFCENFGFL